jgi:mono/diheme cytochrome c family protein
MTIKTTYPKGTPPKNFTPLEYYLMIRLSLILATALIIGCGNQGSQTQQRTQTQQTEQTQTVDPMKNKGIGPITEVKLSPQIDMNLVKKGEDLFKVKCSACHKIEEKYVGPALKGVTQRRTPEWIMNMILNPEEMTKKDPIAKELLAEYLTQMVAQVKDTTEARAILEYLRFVDSQK